MAELGPVGGPAPMQPYHENLVHYNWHWFWDFGNGELGNNGIHLIDVVRWAMQKKLPVRVHSTGGRFGYKDQATDAEHAERHLDLRRWLDDRRANCVGCTPRSRCPGTSSGRRDTCT